MEIRSLARFHKKDKSFANQKQPPEVFCKKVFLRNFVKFTGKYQSFFFDKVAGLIKKTLAQVFYCEFCEISKNIYLREYPWANASS